MSDLILRSINLPRTLDEALRVLALHRQVPKSEMMVKILQEYVAEEAKSNPVLAEILGLPKPA